MNALMSSLSCTMAFLTWRSPISPGFYVLKMNYHQHSYLGRPQHIMLFISWGKARRWRTSYQMKIVSLSGFLPINHPTKRANLCRLQKVNDRSSHVCQMNLALFNMALLHHIKARLWTNFLNYIMKLYQ